MSIRLDIIELAVLTKFNNDKNVSKVVCRIERKYEALEEKLKQSIALLDNITVNDNETSMTMIRDWLMENQ